MDNQKQTTIRRQVIIGDKFGALTVESAAPSMKRRGRNGKISSRERWNCRCECGVIREYNSGSLRRGKATKCKGCAYKLRPQSVRRMSYFERLYSLRIGGRLKKEGIGSTLTVDDFAYLITNDCHYCGRAPQEIDYVGNTKYTAQEYKKVNGIDRVDPNADYSYENCVPACWVCNRGKAGMSLQEWEQYLKELVEFRTRNKGETK